jgi:hypothetical protein
VCLALLLGAGCKSECRRLCDTQHSCSTTAEESDKSLSPEKRIELCRTMCESMRNDPDRAASMEAILPCADASCADLPGCIAKVDGPQSATPGK